MDLVALQPIFSTLWVVWFFVLFIGILLRVLAPGRKQDFERQGQIPFREHPSDRQR
jgi:cytochrome c oxidase cbb3-type subunit 4